MVTATNLPGPAKLRESLEYQLHKLGQTHAHAKVQHRDANHRPSPAWSADHAEVAFYHTSRSGPGALTQLEHDVRELPGVYQTVIITGTRSAQLDPAWPVTYRDLKLFRPQVRALWRPVEDI
jgi:hypothetical protein